ncbi:GntR family transcriptional regulator [Actinomadura sp. 1N219]|uniref:GntR family transcriptional regulator n=1 Tax=Actinomadura sp. 1N219 TaxID=3375152 RepID=UPI003787CBD8
MSSEPSSRAKASPSDRSSRAIKLDLPSDASGQPQVTDTVEQRIAQELRRLIAEGDLAPGAHLPLRQLAAHFGVSITPVRVALIELAAAGLVVSRPHSGMRVAPMSLEEFEEVWTIRVGLEWWLTRRAVEQVQDHDIEHLRGALEKIQHAAHSKAEWPEYVGHSWNYRRYLYSLANRPQMLSNLDTMYVRSARYSRLMLVDGERIHRAAASMEEAHAAVERRDAAAAQEVLRRGMEWTMEAALKQFVSDLPATQEW